MNLRIRLDFFQRVSFYVIVLLTVVYGLNRHYIRPYIISHTDNSFLKTILYSLPNFLGALILYIGITRLLIGNSPLRAALLIVVYSVCHEYANVLFDGLRFDWNDMVAAIIGVVLALVYDYVLNGKKFLLTKADENDKNH